MHTTKIFLEPLLDRECKMEIIIIMLTGDPEWAVIVLSELDKQSYCLSSGEHQFSFIALLVSGLKFYKIKYKRDSSTFLN